MVGGAPGVDARGRPDPRRAALAILNERYPGARTLFLCGSVLRGEATSTSDLDLVVVFERIPNAYRESFIYEGWPVEVFVQDPETLAYFFEVVEPKSAGPALAWMIQEGVPLPQEDDFSDRLKALANAMLAKGPAAWTADEFAQKRYAITDTLDDLREPRSKEEALAGGAKLYGQLAEFFFRSRKLWVPRGKHIPRTMRKIDSVEAEHFIVGFDALFRTGELGTLLPLTERWLQPYGGLLFSDYKSDAPVQWRMV